MGRLWPDLGGDSVPFRDIAGVVGTTCPDGSPLAHGEAGRGTSKDALNNGTAGGVSAARKTCGEPGALPRSSRCLEPTFSPSKCDLREETGFYNNWVRFLPAEGPSFLRSTLRPCLGPRLVTFWKRIIEIA